MESTFNTKIVSAIQSAVKALSGCQITLKGVLDYLRADIVDWYDGSDFVEYRRIWYSAIKENIPIDTVKPRWNWEDIYLAVIAKLAASRYDWQQIPKPTPIPASTRRSSRSSSSNISVTTATSVDQSVDSDSPSVKISKLSSIDKENIRLRYDRLDRNKMWKLSTGTIVEDKMREVALSMEYEHPTHSLILDISDKCWEKVFEKDEKNEIRSYRCIDLPVMSPEVESYLKELQGLSGVDLKKKVDSGDFPTESDSSWLQKSYQDAFRLVRSGFFPLQGQTETNIVKRVWSCVDTCFDFSVINSMSGEKCSKASADSANKERCLSDFGRQSSGRKMDYIFLTGSTEIELGCGECALVEGVKSTKELTDANFKMPKVMKDMANRILLTRSGMAHDLCLVGFYMGGAKMQLYTMDFPAGYVARWDGFGPVEFPKDEHCIGNRLAEVLELVVKGRWLLEATKKQIDGYRVTNAISRLGFVPDHIVDINLLNTNLVRSSKETTLLRARSNQSFLDFANSLKHLNQHQKYYLQQQLKEAFMKNRRDPDVVDKQFKAAVRVIYLYEYFGEAFILCPRFFTKKILVGPHAEWNAVHSYLEKQKGKPHLLQEIDFAVAGDCNQMDSLCVGTREEI